MDRIINMAIKEIDEYWNFIEKAIEIDSKNYHINIKKEDLTKLIISYELEKQTCEKLSTYFMISFYGHPYITINMCMEAIKNKKNIILATEKFYYATNSVIVEIFNNIIQELGMKLQISIKKSLGIEEIKVYNKNIEKLICIGNEEVYFKLLKEKLEPEFIPFNNIQLYCRNAELEELKKAIYEFGEQNYFEIEIFGEDDNFIETIEEMREYGHTCVLLTKDEMEKKFFKEKIKKECYINKNPIKFNKIDIVKDLINK